MKLFVFLCLSFLISSCLVSVEPIPSSPTPYCYETVRWSDVYSYDYCIQEYYCGNRDCVQCVQWYYGGYTADCLGWL